ncbi:ROK family protein [Eggerthellaceae bacterium zg-886]|uniref:ROK family protein n=2 Tax=Xiamenia xianingshaonis TaxID=2682776 RepID=A0ABX0IEY0_9ACTN|nr:ROK family protein [Xiamenia xianingshaonis]
MAGMDAFSHISLSASPAGEHDATVQYIGIDLGGTATKAVVLSADGAEHAWTSVPTPPLTSENNVRTFIRDLRFGLGMGPTGGTEASSASVADRAGSAARAEAGIGGTSANAGSVAGVGLAVAGAVDSAGVLRMAPNITLDLDLLRDALTRDFRCPTFALNDASAAAFGEQQLLPKGDAPRSLVLVTLGTGVGAGVVVDGRVVPGSRGAAGEVGHITVEADGHPCGCGSRGCLEQYASARGLVRLARERAAADGLPLSPEPTHDSDAYAVFLAAANGNAPAQRAVYELARRLGQALATIACVIDPDVFLIGGGLAGSAEAFLPATRDAFREHACPACRDTPIEAARQGNRAGALGAALFACSQVDLA